jgi:hypothetical protein
MDNAERLASWKNLAVEACRAAGREGVEELEAAVWKSEDDLLAFFDCFRPTGAGLEKVFAGVTGGDEILKRLRRVYALTDTTSRWGYFLVRRPIGATPERLVNLTRQHLEKVRQIAHSVGDGDLASMLAMLPEIEIKREAASAQTLSDFNAPEALAYDAVSDWFIGLEPVQSDALLMGEAFYSIACDYNIARYLMWPLYRHSTDIEEPFAPYFELWTHGARPFFGKAGLVTVYAAGNT